MKLQRILFVAEPGRYGVFFVVRQLFRYLREHHPEVIVDLAYSTRRGSEELLVMVEEVRARGGEAIDLQVSNAPELGDFSAARRLWSLVRRRSPQLVHAHSSKAGGLCRLLACLPGFPPVIYTPHAYYGLGRLGGKKEKLFNCIESLLGRIGRTQVVSSDERRFAVRDLKVPGRSVILINNGINVGHFTPPTPAEKAAARAKLGLPAAGKLLASLGRVGVQKNYPPLYAALQRLLAEQPDIAFAHVGIGATQCRDEVAAALRDRCYAFERMQDIRQLYWAADGFILTSQYEGMSASVLEASGCGVPLLLTDAPGLAVMRAYALQVDWMPNPAQSADFTGEVYRAMVTWSRRPPGAAPGQRESVCRNFDEQVQFSKMMRLYQWLAGRR